jgi:hypothetical protein
LAGVAGWSWAFFGKITRTSTNGRSEQPHTILKATGLESLALNETIREKSKPGAP